MQYLHFILLRYIAVGKNNVPTIKKTHFQYNEISKRLIFESVYQTPVHSSSKITIITYYNFTFTIKNVIPNKKFLRYRKKSSTFSYSTFPA